MMKRLKNSRAWGRIKNDRGSLVYLGVIIGIVISMVVVAYYIYIYPRLEAMQW